MKLLHYRLQGLFSSSLALSFFFASYANAQYVYSKSDLNEIILESKILKETCKAFVYLPENYQNSSEKYPVVYILDGEYYFSFTTEASVLLSQNRLAPNCILVGITTNNRERDFTPKADEDSGQSQDLNASGGADNFLEYLEKELKPGIDKKYRTQGYNVLIGHSTGGLLAFYSLYKKPNLFQAIVPIDASTWWNKGKIGSELIDFLNIHPEFSCKIFECRKDIKIPVRFPVNVALIDYLKDKRPKGIEYEYLELPEETHGTVVFPGTYYGLKYIFKN